MFENIDFKSGTVTWKCESLEEDMLMLNFPNQIYLNAGFTNKFYIVIYRDFSETPDSVYTAENIDEFLYILPYSVEKAENLSKINKAYYGGLWKTQYYSYDDLKNK